MTCDPITCDPLPLLVRMSCVLRNLNVNFFIYKIKPSSPPSVVPSLIFADQRGGRATKGKTKTKADQKGKTGAFLLKWSASTKKGSTPTKAGYNRTQMETLVRFGARTPRSPTPHTHTGGEAQAHAGSLRQKEQKETNGDT